jgi:hypothetical protein
MEGAARIMQRYSNPVLQCSTSLGRSLFEWLCAFEDLFCILAAYEYVVPRYWRQENVRIREILARIEYKHLTVDERKRRILDDVWAHMYNSGPQLRDIIAGAAALKSLHGEAKWERASALELRLRDVDQQFSDFMSSSIAQEVLEPGLSRLYENKHLTCCPPFLLDLSVFKCPEAGVFKIASLCLQAYIKAVLHPLLRAELDPEDDPIELGGSSAMEIAVELCKAFAGLEVSLPDTPEIIIPCQAPMMIAALACPPELRLWVYCKLRHLENLGQPMSDVLKQQLAIRWDMPEIAIKGYDIVFGDDLCAPGAQMGSGPMGIIEEMEDLSLRGDDGSDETDGSLESLTQHRGIFFTSTNRDE